jgi:TolB-like protein
MKLQLAELRDRGVFQTLAGYAVISWVLIEVTSVIAPAFLLPDWVVAALTTLLVLGALPVLLLSWRYEFTLEGIKRDTRVVPDEFDRSARSVMTLIIVFLLAITTMLWVNYFRSQSKSEVEELLEAQQGAPEIAIDGQIRSVAVLPFDDYSPGGGKGLLADGIAEAILHVLAQNKGLVVTSRKSSFMFRDKDVSAAEIGRILNVEALLEGSIQIVKNRLRVTSQLIRTSDQAHIWSNVYEAPLDDLFKVNDEIAFEVRNLILPKNQISTGPQGQPHPPSVAAFQLLLEARELIGDLESSERAIRLINVILDMWPAYSDAWAWLAMALDSKGQALLRTHTVSNSVIGKIWEDSVKAAEMALELNPNNHLAMLTIGFASAESSAEGYHDAISKVFDAAPNDPRVLKWLAGLMHYSAAYEEAERLLARAHAVDPSDVDVFQSYMWSSCGAEPQLPMVEIQLQDYPVSRIRALFFLFMAQYCDRQLIESVTTAIKLARIDSDPVSALIPLRILASLGHDEALALIGKAHRLMPRSFRSVDFGRSNLVYFEGILPERLNSYRRHIKSKLGDPHWMFAIALVMSGDNEEAEKHVDIAKSGWDRFYASEGGTFWQSKTIAIYAYKAWLLSQRGQHEEAGEIAAELLQALDEARIAEWSGSRGLFDDIPLMILLLNKRQQQAVDWLLDAESGQWMLFQSVLTNPVYAEFREIPEVADALSRMVAWRAGVLDELMASGLPEVQDPSLLLDLLESLVKQTSYEKAQIALHFDDDPTGALQHYQQALEKDPDNIAVLKQMGGLALEHGFIYESVLLSERMVSLAPEDASALRALGWSYACEQRWDDAISSYQKAFELEPDWSDTQRTLGLMLILNGEPETAMKVIQNIEDKWQQKLGLVWAYYALGQQAESDAALTEWLELDAQDSPLHTAYTAAFRGDPDLAFEWLYKAAVAGPLVSQAAVDPFLIELHEDPRWLPFLESIGKSPQQLDAIEFKVSLPQ